MRQYGVTGCGIVVGFVLIALASACYLIFGDIFWGPWPLSAKALKSLERGEMDSALMFANRAVQSRPEMAMTYRVRAEVRETRSEFREAIEDYTKAFLLGRDVTGLVDRGRVHEKMGEFGNAAADYCQALRSDRDVRYIALGRVMGPSEHNTDRYPDAVSSLLKFFNQAIEREPDNQDLRECRELILQDKRNHEEK